MPPPDTYATPALRCTGKGNTQAPPVSSNQGRPARPQEARLTKADRTRHSQEPDTLTAPQAVAVELVAQGKNDADAATAAGVSRQTVNEWRHRNPAFIAAVNAARFEMYAAPRERLRSLASKAVGVLEKAMDAPPITALPAAVATLKAVASLPAPKGSVTPDAVLRELAEARVSAEEAAIPKSELDFLLDEQDRAPRVKAMMELMRREG